MPDPTAPAFKLWYRPSDRAAWKQVASGSYRECIKAIGIGGDKHGEWGVARVGPEGIFSGAIGETDDTQTLKRVLR